MSVLRSTLFNVAFYVNTFVWAVVFCLPTFVLPRRAIIGMAQAWARSNLLLLRVIVGTDVAMGDRAAAEVARGRQLIIFPEGTRRSIGAPPDYRYGVAHLYRQLDVACVPVALNAGLFWPRRSFMRRPGTIVVEFLEPIVAGRDPDEFLRELEVSIETASNRLLPPEFAI